MGKILWQRKKFEKKEKKRQNPRPKINLKLPQFRLGGLKPFLIFTGIFATTVSIFAFLSSNLFEIKSIEIYGTNQLDDSAVLQNIESFRGKNIFVVNTSEVRNNINQTSIFLKEIYIEKKLPDSLSVFVVERFPKLVIVNFHGAFLLDNENVVVKTLSKTDGIPASHDELQILLGYSDWNSKFIEETMKKDLDEEQKKQFDFKKIDEETKKRLFFQIQNNLKTQVAQAFEQNSKAVSTTEFANFERIFIYDNTDFEIGENVSETTTKFPTSISSYFREEGKFTPTSLIWLDGFTLKVETVENKNFIFSSRRDTFLQTEDLTLILERLETEGEEFSSIDVSSGVISVK